MRMTKPPDKNRLATDDAGTRIGIFINAHHKEIVSVWEKNVARLPEGRRLERPALRNALPEFLSEVARYLREDGKGDDGRYCDIAIEHAMQRFEHGVELRHLTTEYRILRQVVLELYAQACDGRVDVDDVICFNEVIDQSLTDAVDHYTRERDETREQFIDILGHDLRNPLNAITVAASSVLEQENLDPTLHRQATRIQSSAGRIAALIESLLDLARSRLGSGIPIEVAPMSMEAVARAVFDELRTAHPDRLMTFRTTGNVTGLWDKGRVAQAISNILANAIQHGQDPIAVTVEDAGHERVIVEVTNGGDPIPEDALPTLFKPYARHDEARPRRAGLGLGLYIASAILAAHGGSLELSSSAADGTILRLHWPRRNTQPTADSKRRVDSPHEKEHGGA